MTPDPIRNLPPDFSVSVLESGTLRLWHNDRPLQLFVAGTSRERIEGFAAGYDAGRDDGQAAGLAAGRRSLAADLRGLLQLP